MDPRREEEAIRKGRRSLLFMQMFSTLAYSVLYGTLILYATQGLHLSDRYSTALVGSFIAFNYALHVLGGYVGGRLLSYRGLFVFGMLLNAIGCAAISISNFEALLWGSAIFLTGAGLNVICINCMLTQFYKPHDKRRETAFLWNYSAMNVGFFIGFSVSGYFQLHQNYHTLFLLSAFGSLISFALTFLNWKHLADHGTYYAEATSYERLKRAFAVGGIVIALVVSLSWLLDHADFSNELILFMGGIVTCILVAIAIKQPTLERAKKMWAFLILAMGGLIFWTLYQMAPMGLTLFF